MLLTYFYSTFFLGGVGERNVV